MYNFARVYSDKKRSIKVSLPYYIYGKSNRKRKKIIYTIK